MATLRWKSSRPSFSTPKGLDCMADPALSPRPALSDIGQSHLGGGATICELLGLGIATMQARKGQHVFLRERIKQHFVLELPGRPAIVRAGEITFAGTGPNHWLALSESGGPLFG